MNGQAAVTCTTIVCITVFFCVAIVGSFIEESSVTCNHVLPEEVSK